MIKRGEREIEKYDEERNILGASEWFTPVISHLDAAFSHHMSTPVRELAKTQKEIGVTANHERQMTCPGISRASHDYITCLPTYKDVNIRVTVARDNTILCSHP
jgi:hypothetical protein